MTRQEVVASPNLYIQSLDISWVHFLQIVIEQTLQCWCASLRFGVQALNKSIQTYKVTQGEMSGLHIGPCGGVCNATTWLHYINDATLSIYISMSIYIAVCIPVCLYSWFILLSVFTAIYWYSGLAIFWFVCIFVFCMFVLLSVCITDCL